MHNSMRTQSPSVAIRNKSRSTSLTPATTMRTNSASMTPVEGATLLRQPSALSTVKRSMAAPSSTSMPVVSSRSDTTMARQGSSHTTHVPQGVPVSTQTEPQHTFHQTTNLANSRPVVDVSNHYASHGDKQHDEVGRSQPDDSPNGGQSLSTDTTAYEKKLALAPTRRLTAPSATATTGSGTRTTAIPNIALPTQSTGRADRAAPRGLTPTPKRSASKSNPDADFSPISIEGTRKRYDLKAGRETGISGVHVNDYIVDVSVPLDEGRFNLRLLTPPPSQPNSARGLPSGPFIPPGDFTVILDASLLDEASYMSLSDGGYCKHFGRGKGLIFGKDGVTASLRHFEIKGVPSVTPEGEVRSLCSPLFIECDVPADAKIPSSHSHATQSCVYRCIRGTVVGYFDKNLDGYTETADRLEHYVPQTALQLIKVPSRGRVVLWIPRGQKHCMPLDLSRCREVTCVRCSHCQGVIPKDETAYHQVDYHGANGQSPRKFEIESNVAISPPVSGLKDSEPKMERAFTL